MNSGNVRLVGVSGTVRLTGVTEVSVSETSLNSFVEEVVSGCELLLSLDGTAP